MSKTEHLGDTKKGFNGVMGSCGNANICTIEALQQENEQLRAQLDEWKYEVKCHMDEVIAREKQMARMRELLTKAYDEIEQTLAEIDKVIGGKEDVTSMGD
jgi:predicted  nucleic acid-binding Zn-ribbon protein